jgi:hypothetical protein
MQAPSACAVPSLTTHPQPGDVLIERPLALVEYEMGIVPYEPHIAWPTYDVAVARGHELAGRLHVDLWLTEDHIHFLQLGSYRPQPQSGSQFSKLAPAPGRSERCTEVECEALLQRVRAEFDEEPGLVLTLSQAERLFGVGEDTCRRVLGTLVREGTLHVSGDGAYGRRDDEL